jgi:hypothetical protein
MTAPVDVLAVMDAEYGRMVAGTASAERRNANREARAAVAELLEMADYMIHEREAMGPLNPDWQMFSAALARCKGGAA